MVDGYRLDDAEVVLVMSNSFATKGRGAVDQARAEGIPLGLLRLRVLRPFHHPVLPRRLGPALPAARLRVRQLRVALALLDLPWR